MPSLTILQPFIPHYREDFFVKISQAVQTNITCYEEVNKMILNNFNGSDIEFINVRKVSFGPFLIYNLFSLTKSNSEDLVLMLNFGHLSTWLLLYTKLIHKKKIVLWGHGISVKRYIKEEKKPSILLKWMIKLSDGVWFYTEKELEIWKKIFPLKQMVALNNTISGVEKILDRVPINVTDTKRKYGIEQECVLIFCARFNNEYRRTDLLLKVIEDLDPNYYGIIIIGDGPVKPDFSKYKNVYDYGAVYDTQKKDELFQISDIYFQPAWVGLSIVEAMAYGKPVFTFKRTEELLQCVEYHYIVNDYNGVICDSVEQMTFAIEENFKNKKVMQMGENAKKYVSSNLTIQNMVENALKVI